VESELGSDEFDPMKANGTMPDFSAEPSKGAGANNTNNVGTVGKAYGCFLKGGNTYAIKDWQFTYCTNRYW
jgi:hypothetical protein